MANTLALEDTLANGFNSMRVSIEVEDLDDSDDEAAPECRPWFKPDAIEDPRFNIYKPIYDTDNIEPFFLPGCDRENFRNVNTEHLIVHSVFSKVWDGIMGGGKVDEELGGR